MLLDFLLSVLFLFDIRFLEYHIPLCSDKATEFNVSYDYSPPYIDENSYFQLF